MKTYCAVNMVYPTIRICIDRVTRIQYDANMTGVQRMYSGMMCKVVSQKYERGFSLTELETLQKDGCEIKHKVLNMIQTVCSSKIFTLKFRDLDHLTKAISGFESLFALDALPYKQCNEITKAAYRQVSNRRPTHMDEMVFGLD